MVLLQTRPKVVVLPALAAMMVGWVDGAGAGPPGTLLSQAAPGIECRCRANGRSYELGARVCLLTPSGYRVAECRMQQNVSSWTFGSEECSLSAAWQKPLVTVR